MAFQLGSWIVAGELINTHRNSVHGWLELQGRDTPVLLQLTGNLSPDLAGQRIRFEARHYLDMPAPDAEGIAHIAWQQVGPTGEMTATRRVRVSSCSPREALRHRELGEPLPLEWKPCLYLEWHSQNGPVVVELIDPIMEAIDDDSADALEDEPLDALDNLADEAADEPPGWEENEELLFGESSDEEEGDDEEEDPFGLLPPGLNDELERQALQTDRAILGEATGPGDDEEEADVLAEMQLLDHLMEYGEEVPVGDVFDTLVQLPKADALTEGEAETALKSLLARLALRGIALDICEHFTMRQAYRLLVDTICREEAVYPELSQTRWVQHFATHEYCPHCDPTIQEPGSESQRGQDREGRSGEGEES